MRMPFVWLLPVALIVATAVASALFAHPIETSTPVPASTPTLEPTVLAAQTIEPTSASSPSLEVRREQGEVSATPSPFPSPYQGEGQMSQQGPSISFIDLPNTLSAGQKTKVTIKIDGPTGTKGDNAKIKVKYHTSEEKNNSSSSIKTDISNSFGSFTTPATFSMNLSLGQEKAPIEITASAEINGQMVETTKIIELKL